MSNQKKYKLPYLDNIISATKFLALCVVDYVKRNPN